MKIYTRTGDNGETGLYGGQRVPKDGLLIEAIGTLDELNAFIGVCKLYLEEDMGEMKQWFSRIQCWIFELSSEICTPRSNPHYKESITQTDIEALEASIDLQEEELSPLRNFILPGGSLLAAHLHLTRTVCRRAERVLLGLSRQNEIRKEILVFLNRLSDWLFVTARTANRLFQKEDVLWATRGEQEK